MNLFTVTEGTDEDAIKREILIYGFYPAVDYSCSLHQCYNIKSYIQLWRSGSPCVAN